MEVIGSIAQWIADNLFSQPAFLIGLIALIGLVAQRSSFSDTVLGTLKTAVGFLILSQGANIVVGALLGLVPMLEGAFGFQAAALGGAKLDEFIANFGGYAALIMTFGFLINVLLARITPLKYIYLTGHLMWWISLVVLAAMVEITPNASVLGYVLIGSIICGVYWTLQPAYVQPLMRKLTGHDELAYGHTSSSNVWLAAKLGGFVGKPEQSTEEVELPPWLSFFRDITAGTALVIVVMLLIATIIGGIRGVEGQGLEGIVPAIMLGLEFAMGITVLLFGVRMLIAEIVPAFRGIALRIVPDSKPALDCPIVFDYAPTAVIIGFLSATITFFILMVIFGVTGLAVIVPPFIMLFFPGGAGGVFGNMVGGVRGAILGGAILGLLLAVGQAIFTPLMGGTAPELAQLADPDWYFLFIIARTILAPIMPLFGG
ncbi:MAG: PTS ascorbate transporter subunit IIC [Anaerolineales bacterium]|nr:PTS ascorbate transporter subunit IIC [Anaerolineales bacterium]